MAIPDTTKTLTTIIEALKPLDSAERHRTVNAAMLFLGEVAQTATAQRKQSTEAAGRDIIDGSYPPAVNMWMQQNDISPEELDRVFHFQANGFDIHGAPGKSKESRR